MDFLDYGGQGSPFFTTIEATGGMIQMMVEYGGTSGANGQRLLPGYLTPPPLEWSTFPGVGVQYPSQKPPPHLPPSNIGDLLFDIRKYISGYKGPVFTVGFGN
ncbi:hypothetical protein H107_00458 [Trichophyton rubrum CBS 202.88]|nr:hypothetical protein H107_00458 [Trichophyton rubrum CBS 202.88]